MATHSLSVRFFASLTDHVGTQLLTVEIESSTSVASLWDDLVERHPELGGLSYKPMVACDLVYAKWDQLLDTGAHRA